MQVVKYILASLAIFIVSQTSALAAERFVSLTGNDANSGTVSAPFKTITKCVITSASGDVCTLRGGNYTEILTTTVWNFPAGIESSAVRVRAYPNEQVTMRQTDQSTCTGLGSKVICYDNVKLLVSNEIIVETSLPPPPVQTAVSLSVSPANPAPGATVTVTVSGNIPTPTLLDWFGWYTAGLADTAHGTNWRYLNNSQSAPASIPTRPVSFVLIAPASGTVDVRLFANDGYTRLASASFTVAAGEPIPPVNPCTASPAKVTVRSWPSSATGSRRLDYTTSGPAATAKTELSFTAAGTFFKITDTRGCTAEVKK